jgi:hypothetical protein
MPSAVADDVDEVFRAALEKDAGVEGSAPADIPAPPRKSVLADPDAPHGRGPDGVPLTPFGTNKKTGKPNLRRPGKPPKDDRPRVQENTGPAGSTQARPAVKRDWSQEISELLDGTWMLMSSAPIPLPKVRVKVHAQAALLNGHKPGLVKGINLAAQNNPQVARGVEKLTTGNVSWILPAMFALGPFVAQSVMVWRSPVEGTVEELALGNEIAWDETVKAMAAQFGPQAEAGEPAE